jgi:hypothetical protein
MLDVCKAKLSRAAKLLLEEDRLQAGQVGSVEDIFVGNIALPLDAKNVAETTLVEAFQ